MVFFAVKFSADKGHLISTKPFSSINLSGEAPKHEFSVSVNNSQSFTSLFNFLANSSLAIFSLLRPYLMAAVSMNGEYKIAFSFAIAK